MAGVEGNCTGTFLSAQVQHQQGVLQFWFYCVILRVARNKLQHGLGKIEDLAVSGWIYFNQGLTVDK